MRDFILADNQELTRLGLKALLSEYTDTTVTIVEDKAALIERLRHDSHTVVVIDYTLFDFTDEDNLLIVVDRFPEAMWLLISDDLNHATVKKFLYSSKRISIVFKDTPIYLLREAINVTRSGSRYICQHATEVLLSDIQEERCGRRSSSSCSSSQVSTASWSCSSPGWSIWATTCGR